MMQSLSSEERCARTEQVAGMCRDEEEEEGSGSTDGAQSG